MMMMMTMTKMMKLVIGYVEVRDYVHEDDNAMIIMTTMMIVVAIITKIKMNNLAVEIDNCLSLPDSRAAEGAYIATPIYRTYERNSRKTMRTVFMCYSGNW